MQLWDGSRPGYRAANTARKSPCIVYWYFSTPLSHRSVQFRAHQVEAAGRLYSAKDWVPDGIGYLCWGWKGRRERQLTFLLSEL